MTDTREIPDSWAGIGVAPWKSTVSVKSSTILGNVIGIGSYGCTDNPGLVAFEEVHLIYNAIHLDHERAGDCTWDAKFQNLGGNECIDRDSEDTTCRAVTSEPAPLSGEAPAPPPPPA